MIDLKALIQSALDLEPLPASVTRLAGVIAREESSLDDVVDVLQFDQALTARVLRAANSAASAAQAPVTTVKNAVMRLGSGAVLSLATASVVQSRMSGSVPQYGLSEGALWHHSVAAAVGAECLARRSRRSFPPEAFTAALLHDIGKLVLSRYLEPDVLRVLNAACEVAGVDRLAAEAEILGVNHAELGALIAQHWEMPDTIVQGISFHHCPDAVETSAWSDRPDIQAIADLAAISNLAAHAAEADPEAEPPGVKDQGAALARLGMNLDAFDLLVQATRDQLEQVLVRYR